MRVTGYALREAIRKWQLRRDTSAAQFPETLVAFPGEVKPTPTGVSEAFLAAEMALTRLQTAQTQYNLTVRVDVDGDNVPLLQAIREMGALGRIEKAWRGAATGKKDKYSLYRANDPNRRKVDEVFAERVIPQDEAVQMVSRFAAEIGKRREAIATANATAVEIDLDAKLFE